MYKSRKQGMVVLICKCRTALVAGFQPPLLIIIVQSLIRSVFLSGHYHESCQK